jgi:hypothetical protein
MREFVDNDISERLDPGHRGRLLKQVGVIKRDDSNILHASPLVLIQKDHLVFREGMFVVEILLKEFGAFEGQLPDKGGVSFQVGESFGVGQKVEALAFVGGGAFQAAIRPAYYTEEVGR